ncbi:hypothetical protein B0H11DRAFT_1734913 [Mycena galericulata]|nr:hypothetical protein B0H11DRAFT_1734913 [Mycena galericulata]
MSAPPTVHNIGRNDSQYYLPSPNNSWPDYVQRAFDNIDPHDRRENALYGAWNKLLNFLFPIHTDFLIEPQGPVVDTHQTIDYSISFNITTGNADTGLIALVAVELKPAWRVNDQASLRQADTQMRDRLVNLRPATPIRTLYGISAFGNYFCIYKMKGMTITPHVVPVNTKRQSNLLSKHQWKNPSTDIYTPEGRVNFVATVQRIKSQLCTYIDTGEAFDSEVGLCAVDVPYLIITFCIAGSTGEDEILESGSA